MEPPESSAPPPRASSAGPAPHDAPATSEADAAESPAPPGPPASGLQRLGRRPFFFLAGGVVLALAFAGPKLPRDQRLRVVLGGRAKTTTAARIAWGSSSGEALREATFRYGAGEAPETLIQELRLPDGDYEVDVEIVTLEGRSVVRKRVTLTGASTTLDVSGRP